MEVLNRVAIKKDARAFIGQDTRWLKMFLAILPVLLLSGGISFGVSFAEAFSSQSDESVNYTTSVWTNIISVLLIPFTVAMAGYFLNQIRGFNPSWQSLYKEGFDRYGSYLKTGFITNLVIGLWTMLFIIPGFIKALAYSQVNCIIHDNPSLSPKQARDISDRITKGFKGDLFVLGLSFFLWEWFGIITFGFGMIYVIPYMQTVMAMYYENLKNYALANGTVRPEELGIMPVPPYGDVPPAGAPFAQGPQQPFAANPYNANPYAAPTEPPYAANPYNANPTPYNVPTEPTAPAEPTFTPPAPEVTFQPGDADTTVLNGEEIDNTKQDF